LEAELVDYRRRFGAGHSSFKQENTNSALLEDGNIEVPVINTPRDSNSLVSFEDERAYIQKCLRKLEQKLQSYSNNSTSADISSSDALEDGLSSKVSTAEDQRSSRDTQEHISLGREEGSSMMSWEVHLTKVQEEIASLSRRLKTLEGDRNFLEHSINSLRNGNEGLMFIQEIARNLRELRAIAMDMI
jgi:predicted RNase H-like nuclease (RuvC/YqgF family)